MSPGVAHAPVVVAVDDAVTAADALDWASAEAAARRCRLRIVHAFHAPPPDPYCIASATDNLLTARATAETVLREAAARARSVSPEVEVSAVALQGKPGHALLGEAAGAQMVVLGSGTRHGLRGLLARSISAHLAAHAPCPVVVIRLTHPGDAHGWSPPGIVVGVDALQPAALGFAFRAARQRGLPLVAVRVWTPDPPADLEGVSGGSALAEQLARRTLEHALDLRRPEFPDVAVHAALVRGDPARALLHHSRTAALLVLGTRGRGHLGGAALGPVGRGVLRHGHGPVAVVHQAPAPSMPAAAERDRGSGRRGSRGHRDTPGDRRRPV